jgi:hypothetical protein
MIFLTADKSKIQATWRPKNNFPPVSAHVHSSRVSIRLRSQRNQIFLELKGIIGEHVDRRHPAYVALVNDLHIVVQQEVHTLAALGFLPGFTIVSVTVL